MTGRILIGTASWTDPTLVKDGHFYPPEAKSAEARLRFYAEQFLPLATAHLRALQAGPDTLLALSDDQF